jgi:DNA polymerase III epsilon subunit-like protein
MHSIHLCKIYFEGKTSGAYKWPKLEELHQHLFNEVPANLHDALTDVKACLRCFLQMQLPVTNYINE